MTKPCDVSGCITQVARSGTGPYMIYQHDRLFSQPRTYTHRIKVASPPTAECSVAEPKLYGRSAGKGQKRSSDQGQPHGSAVSDERYLVTRYLAEKALSLADLHYQDSCSSRSPKLCLMSLAYFSGSVRHRLAPQHHHIALQITQARHCHPQPTHCSPTSRYNLVVDRNCADATPV